METGCDNVEAADTPLEHQLKLEPQLGEEMADQGYYKRIVGKLIYLTITRPDITFAVSTVSQFMQAPRVPQWNGVLRIIKYLKRFPNRDLFYKKGNSTLEIQCFVDADWAGSVHDRRSTSGYCITLGGNMVIWKSNKQTVVARSSAEAEYRALAKAATELIWMKQLLGEIGFPISGSMNLRCDNQAAIHIASNPVFYERTKHIEIDCHYIKDTVKDNIICLRHISAKVQVADF